MAINPARAVQRSISVLSLDVETFEEVEHDTSSTDEAGLIVVATSVIGALGALFSGSLWAFIAAIAIGLIGWFVWSFAAAFIATNIFNKTSTDTGEMLRTTGYAHAPRALGILGFIPILGWIITAVAWIWSVVAFIIGIRQAAEMSTGQAVLTGLVGFIPVAIIMAIVTAILL